jgi:peptidoglycan/LPS O-acetylase OafA/YrhL
MCSTRSGSTLLHAQLRLPFGLADNPKAVVLLALLLTVLSAMLSYHFFEKPILRLKKRFQVVPTR